MIPQVVACEVMAQELREAARGLELKVCLVDQGLHLTPERMKKVIQEKVDRAGPRPVLLGYGLCSNGLMGIRAGEGGLYVPRCHDCIALFMGSAEEFNRRFRQRPGTYYLTPGWLARRKDPLSILREEYAPRLGLAKADWAMRQELKHYTHISLITTGVGDVAAARRRARENCDYFSKQYEEITGSLALLRLLLAMPEDSRQIIRVKPGQHIKQEMFWK